MNPKTALLAGGGVTFFGIIFGIAVSISKSKNLKDVLNSEGKKTLDTDGNKDDETWDKLIANYLKEENKEKITDVDIKQDSPNNKKNLKNRCKALLNTPMPLTKESEKTKEIATNWCTKSSSLLNKE